MSVVVDTSVWIDFFGGEKIAVLEDALRQGAVVLPPLVVAELLSGAHREPDRSALIELLTEVPLVETPLAHWLRVGDLRRGCKEKGLSVSTPDAHVAQCALDQNAMLLARDGIFSDIARRFPLRVDAGR